MGEFYVGYLDVPRGIKRFSIGLVVVVFVVVAGVALLVASQQRDPGDATWGDEIAELQGTLIDTPYPALLLQGQPQQIVLLVSTGKQGARERAAAHLGRSVRVHGTILQRGRTRLLEISDGVDAIEDLGATADGDLLIAAPSAAVELHGEIIDPKCYCGAMKPGEGKTHKACASLCLRGGIPPMFVEDGKRDQPCLLLDAQGRSLAGEQLEALIDFVGEAIVLSAQRGAVADVPTLLVDAASLRRQ